MDQSDLAKLLNVSVAYINQVEEGNINPSDEVEKSISHLFNILNKSFEVFNALLKEFYLLLLDSNLSEEVFKIEKRLLKEVECIQNPLLILKYKIFHANFLRRTNKINEAHDQLRVIEKSMQLFDKELFFYYFRVKGGLFYNVNKLESSLSMFQLAEENMTVNEEAVADLYYNIAMVSTHLFILPKALEYIQKAKRFYKELGYRKKLCWCYSLAGTCYTRLKDNLMAEKYHVKTLLLSKELDYEEFIGKSLHNLATLESSRGNYLKAKEYYLESLTLAKRTNDLPHLIQSTLNISAIFRDLGDYKKALRYVEKGIKWCGQVPNEAKLIKRFETELFLLKYFLKEQWDQYENLTIELIDFLSKSTSWSSASKHAEKLANFYTKQDRYMEASHYYKIALEAKEKLGKVNNV